MFKKIEIWVLYLALMLFIIAGICFGFLVRQELVGSTKLGILSKSALFVAELPVKAASIKRQFLTDGKTYMQVPDRFPGKSGFIGDPVEKPSYLLHSRYDGNIGKSIVELVDLTNFSTVYSWYLPITEINARVDTSVPEYANQLIYNSERRFRAHHSLLDPDGHLYIQAPLAKIDHCSDIKFIKQDEFYHHSMNFDADGNVWIPAHLFPSPLDKKLVGTTHKDFLDDVIRQISPTGELLYEKSVAEMFIEHDMIGRVFLSGNLDHTDDPIHLNDIEPVLETTQYWQKGDVFLSIRNFSMVLLYRPSENRIVWKTEKHLAGQHDVDILDESRISIFNNNMIRGIDDFHVHGVNEIIIYDFETNEYQAYMNNELIEQDVRTITEGLSEMTADGDLFIEETNYGRSLYFNADGSLRWQYFNRADDGVMYRTNWSRLYSNQSDIDWIEKMISNGTLDKAC